MKYGGQIADFPEEVVRKMLKRQVQQGNTACITIFENKKNSGVEQGGFDWGDTKEGVFFWKSTITNSKFDVFFKKYPKKVKEDEYPKLMWVGNTEDDICKCRYKRVVFMFRNDKYLAWGNADSIKEAESKNLVTYWKYAKDVEEVFVEETKQQPKVVSNETLEIEQLKVEIEVLKKQRNKLEAFYQTISKIDSTGFEEEIRKLREANKNLLRMKSDLISELGDTRIRNERLSFELKELKKSLLSSIT